MAWQTLALMSALLLLVPGAGGLVATFARRGVVGAHRLAPPTASALRPPAAACSSSSSRGAAATMMAKATSRRAELAAYTVPKLKEALRARGLPVGGKKDDLIERLVGAAKTANGATKMAPSTTAATSGMSSSSSTTTTIGGSAGGIPAGPAVMVVESPAKCKTIAKFCGGDTIVLACNGHVRQLPSKPGSVRPDEDFAMSFDLVKGGATKIKEIGQALRGARALLLATDPDREGEAIAWHVKEALAAKGYLQSSQQVSRVTFAEITESAVKAALATPRQINVPLVKAQQARQAVDYLVGFTLSPVLWRKLPGCRSAGRVQSVALRLIVERERLIQAFEPSEYWRLKTRIAPGGSSSSLLAEITHLGGARLKQFDVTSEADAQAAMGQMPPSWAVSKVKRTKRQTGPPPPYNTASLQQDASRRLGMGVGRVMRVAQTLYEGVPLDGGENTALITYMRTDGIEMSEDGLNGARSYISSAFGKDEAHLPLAPRVFKKKARNAQESHEAIRPVEMSRTPVSLRGKLGDQELRLYELIWRRAIASQMANAVHEQLAITLHPEEEAAAKDKSAEARASGSRLLLPGYKAVYSMPSAVPPRTEAKGEDDDDEEEDEEAEAEDEKRRAEEEEDAGGLDPLLQSLAEGDVLRTSERLPSQHFTEPPPRFSEGSLVRHLEELGIGRPSTYASIMRSLQERGYCTMVSKALRPQQRGELVTALLTCDELAHYVETDFTARLEAQLDAISNGEAESNAFLDGFWRQFRPAVSAVEGRDTLELREEVAEKCAASLFPAPAPAMEVAAAASPAASSPSAAAAPHPRACPSCGKGRMVLKFSKYGPFTGCSEYPSCGWTTRPRDPTSDDGGLGPMGKASLGVISAADGQTQPHLADKVGLEVSVRDGPVGWYVQLGGNVTHELQQLKPPPDVKALKMAQLREELQKRGLETSGRKADLAERLVQAEDLRPLVPHKRVSLPEGVKPVDVTMDMARRLLSLPALLGQHPEHESDITLHLGRFGSYVRMDMAAEYDEAREATATAVEEVTVMASLPKSVSMWDISTERAAELLDLKLQREAKRRAGAAAGGRGGAAKANKPAVGKSTAKRKPAAKKKKVSTKASSSRGKKATVAA